MELNLPKGSDASSFFLALASLVLRFSLWFTQIFFPLAVRFVWRAWHFSTIAPQPLTSTYSDFFQFGVVLLEGREGPPRDFPILFRVLLAACLYIPGVSLADGSS